MFDFLRGISRWATRKVQLIGFVVHKDGVVAISARLSARVLRANGRVEKLGVICKRVVTTAFVNFLVDQLQAESSIFGDFKYHDAGTGIVAEAIGDVGLGTPWGGARVAGTQVEGSTANIYKSVGTITFNAGFAITEHGLFNAASGVTLMDRSVFSAINVGNGDQIEFTYELTCTAGG